MHPACAERVGAGCRGVCVGHRDGMCGLRAVLLTSQVTNSHTESSVQVSEVL